MKIYVATYEDKSGNPFQKVFKDRKSANTWLKKQFKRDFEGLETTIKEWSEYGAWTMKVKGYNL